MELDLIDITPNFPVDTKWWLLCNESQFTRLGSMMNKKTNKKKLKNRSSQQQPQQQQQKRRSPTYYIDLFLDPNKKLTLELVSDVGHQLQSMPIG